MWSWLYFSQTVVLLRVCFGVFWPQPFQGSCSTALMCFCSCCMAGGALADVTSRLGQILGVKLQQSRSYLTLQPAIPSGMAPTWSRAAWSSYLGQIWCCAGGRLRAAGAHHLACRQCLTASPGMSFAASAASAALSSGSSFPPQLSGMPGSFVTCNLHLVSLSSARISFSPGHLNGVQSN